MIAIMHAFIKIFIDINNIEYGIFTNYIFNDLREHVYFRAHPQAKGFEEPK